MPGSRRLRPRCKRTHLDSPSKLRVRLRMEVMEFNMVIFVINIISSYLYKVLFLLVVILYMLNHFLESFQEEAAS